MCCLPLARKWFASIGAEVTRPMTSVRATRSRQSRAWAVTLAVLLGASIKLFERQEL